MILLNFSHPVSAKQVETIEQLSGQTVEQVFDVPVQFDNQSPFPPQLEALMRRLPLSSEQLQSQPILVNPPALNFIAALVLAELHGRMGYFPAIMRTRPMEGSLPPRYEVAEILNLQAVRDRARRSRGQATRQEGSGST